LTSLTISWKSCEALGRRNPPPKKPPVPWIRTPARKSPSLRYDVATIELTRSVR